MSNRTFMMLSGIVLIIGGILAALAPFAASLAVTLIVGVTLIVAGTLHLVEAFRDADDRLWNAGFGLLGVILGLSFIFNPLGGMLSIAFVLGGLFFATGLMQLYMAWKRRGQGGIVWLTLSGLLSVALAFVIAFNIFAAAATLPGFLLAIELISTGVALIMLRNASARDSLPAAPGTPAAETEVGTTSGVEYPAPRGMVQDKPVPAPGTPNAPFRPNEA